jgi:competence protein ComEA
VEKRQAGLQHEGGTPATRAQTISKINLNRATCAELEILPGIGPTLGRRIVDYREAKGPFKRIEDIMQVRGIGPQTFEQMKDHLTVE